MSTQFHHTFIPFKSFWSSGRHAFMISHISFSLAFLSPFSVESNSFISTFCLVFFSMSQGNRAEGAGRVENRRHKKDTAGDGTEGGECRRYR